jgi:hypothetical protein
MKKKTTVTFLGVALLCLTMASAAFAGLTYSTEVWVNGYGKNAGGGLGSARHSADNNQYLGCNYDSGSPATGWCYANDANNNYGSCTTSNASMIDAIKSMNGDSYITFSWDNNTNCTYIQANKASQYAPK